MELTLTDLQGCKSIAVMGGTFDPVHNGHLAAAEAVRREVCADCTLFIPAKIPPHKDMHGITDFFHRYDMLAASIAHNPYFAITKMEAEREGPSYTVDTLKLIKAACAENAKIFFIAGTDSMQQIIGWKDAEEIFSLCTMTIVTRPGYSIAKLPHGMECMVVHTPSVDVSGTQIRARVAAGEPIKYLVPEEADAYIKRHSLYKDTDDERMYKTMRERLQKTLSPKRYAHSLGVMKKAMHYASLYGADIYKAKLAGLLHDCAKEYFPAYKRILCERYGIETDEILSRHIDIAHSYISAEVARDEYGVYDSEVLDAIRSHTLGASPMTLLEKIIMLADYTDETRTHYDGLDELRSIGEHDINAALCMGILHAQDYARAKGYTIHPRGAQTYEYLQSETRKDS